ncbi:MAG: ABC transporter permease [Betaproteobacteria bacterium]
MSGIVLFLRRFARNRPALIGAIVLAAILVGAIAGPLLYPVDPFDMVGRPFQLPFGKFALGTDVAGRDLLAGILRGARVSLMIAIVATVGAMVIGLLVGAISGYYGGVIDNVLMAITDFFLTIPSFVLAVVVVAIFQPSLITVTAAIAVVSWPSVARLVRSEVLAQRDRDYVQACRAMGMSNAEIIFLQILPNALPPIVVVASLMVATAILTESGLSFLGLADPNIVSWGYMIGVARSALRTAWWMTAIPGVAILVTVLAINLIGEGLNDALNPRLRER